MFRAFNMGVGMVVLLPETDAAEVIRAASAAGVRAWHLGEVRRGTGQVILT
jgi:phosphoribosylformylglycinamidine cyclo-ligase